MQIDIKIEEKDNLSGSKYKIHQEVLVNLIRLSEKRDLCEEIDEIEKLYK